MYGKGSFPLTLVVNFAFLQQGGCFFPPLWKDAQTDYNLNDSFFFIASTR